MRGFFVVCAKANKAQVLSLLGIDKHKQGPCPQIYGNNSGHYVLRIGFCERGRISEQIGATTDLLTQGLCGWSDIVVLLVVTLRPSVHEHKTLCMRWIFTNHSSRRAMEIIFLIWSSIALSVCERVFTESVGICMGTWDDQVRILVSPNENNHTRAHTTLGSSCKLIMFMIIVFSVK